MLSQADAIGRSQHATTAVAVGWAEGTVSRLYACALGAAVFVAGGRAVAVAALAVHAVQLSRRWAFSGVECRHTHNAAGGVLT
eukprot:312402-Chlamydomonas_euryale.AAC.1